MNGQENSRNYGLDVVRAGAIFLVVLGHGTTFFPKTATLLGIGGYLGVEMFFVLSGYLIGAILIKAISGSDLNIFHLRAFWIRRWFRTLPNYYLFMMVQIVIGMVTVNFLKTNFDFRHLIFVQHFTAFSGYPMPESWSLCVEEWFYVLFPIVLLILCRLASDDRAAVLGAVGLFLCVAAFARILISAWYFRAEPISMLDWNIYFRGATLLRLDAIAYGVLLAYVVKYHSALADKYRKLQFGVAVIMLFAIILRYHKHPVIS